MACLGLREALSCLSQELFIPSQVAGMGVSGDERTIPFFPWKGAFLWSVDQAPKSPVEAAILLLPCHRLPIGLGEGRSYSQLAFPGLLCVRSGYFGRQWVYLPWLMGVPHPLSSFVKGRRNVSQCLDAPEKRMSH